MFFKKQVYIALGVLGTIVYMVRHFFLLRLCITLRRFYSSQIQVGFPAVVGGAMFYMHRKTTPDGQSLRLVSFLDKNA